MKPFALSPFTVAAALLTLVVILTAISVTGHGLQYFYGTDRFVQFVRLFNLSGEGNIPAWFSSILLFSSALLLHDIAVAERNRGKRRFLKHWWALAIGFVYISMDEAAQIHELSIEPLRERFHTRGLLYEAWIVPATVVVVLLLVIYRRFLAHLPAATRLLFIVSGAVYVTGALGIESVSGYVADYHPDSIVVRGGLATLEDFLEMCGIVLFLYALLMYRHGVRVSRDLPTS